MTKNHFTTSVSLSALAAAMAIGVVTAIAGIAAPAFADVDVTVSIAKDKTIVVDEDIVIDKDVNIDIIIGDVEILEPGTGNPTGLFFLIGLGAAEAQALVNVENTDNVETLEHVVYSADLTGSMSGNTGITQFNQAAGNMQNQGNVVAAAVVDTGDAFANAQAEVQQHNGDGPDEGAGGNVVNAKTSSFTASIGPGSLSGNTGIVQFNQDAGNNNNQTNAVALAAGVDNDGAEDVLVALSEAALGQESSNNVVTEGGGTTLANGDLTNNDATFKSATMDGALNGSTGAVIGVNQAAGNNANQGNVVSVAAFVDF